MSEPLHALGHTLDMTPIPHAGPHLGPYSGPHAGTVVRTTTIPPCGNLPGSYDFHLYLSSFAPNAPSTGAFVVLTPPSSKIGGHNGES